MACVPDRPATAPAGGAALVARGCRCGSQRTPAAARGRTDQSAATAATPAPPAALVAQARPIGRGASFQPPRERSGPRRVRAPARPARRRARRGVCRQPRGARAHRGSAHGQPRQFSAGRISSAGCYGEAGHARPDRGRACAPGSRPGSPPGIAPRIARIASGSPPTLADLFRAWGEPLSTRRLASFSATRRARVAVFVDGAAVARPAGARCRCPATFGDRARGRALRTAAHGHTRFRRARDGAVSSRQDDGASSSAAS